MPFVWLAAIHVAAVIAWEIQHRRSVPWLDEDWGPRLLVATAFVFLLVPTIAFVFDVGFGVEEEPSRTLGFAAFWVMLAASSRITPSAATTSS